MINIDDVRDFDAMLKRRIERFQVKLQDWLAPHRLTLADIRVHKVLIPMVGVYTPGWQALPAASWAFVELVTREGLIGTGEWSIDLDVPAQNCIARLRQDPGRNLLEMEFAEPLFMAWWDLVAQVLEQPLHVLWAELFERDSQAPRAVPMAAYTWQRFPDAQGEGAVTFATWPEHAAAQARHGFPAIKVSMTAYQPEDHIELVQRIRQAANRYSHRRPRNVELPGSPAHTARPGGLQPGVYRTAAELSAAPALLSRGRTRARAPAAGGRFSGGILFSQNDRIAPAAQNAAVVPLVDAPYSAPARRCGHVQPLGAQLVHAAAL